MLPMKRVTALVLLFMLVPALALCGDYCECPDAQTHAARQEMFDRILRQYKTMGASIALIRDGRIVDTFQYGRANRQDDTPITSDTHFRIASITKMVSTIAVMQLIERGALSLDGDLSEVFFYGMRNPYFPNSPVTLRQIMTHTAALRDDYHYLQATKGNITSLEHVLNGNYTQNNYFRREPGTKSDYSNFGGGLMGSIIEEVSGCTIDEYMQQYVFTPLGITGGYHTPCLPHGTQIARIYNTVAGSMTLDLMERTDEHWDPDPQMHYTHTAGALVMTAEGLAKVLIALMGDGTSYGTRLLAPQSVQAMRTRQDHIGSVYCDAARGLNLNIIENRLVNGRTLWGHQGKAYGMICAAYFDPTDATGVVLLTNGCDTATVDSVARIARAVMTQAYKYLEM